MSTSGRHQDIPTDTHDDAAVAEGVDLDAPADHDAVGTPPQAADGTPDESATPAETDAVTDGPVQLALATPDAHVRFHLDRRTRELGLAHVAEIKRQLAASAARRAVEQAAASRRTGRSSGRAA
ncbi:MAG: hypothetical protein ACO3C1_01985 [Ilumatobacteraceae bacterium]